MKWNDTERIKNGGIKKWNRIRKQPINRDVQPYWQQPWSQPEVSALMQAIRGRMAVNGRTQRVWDGSGRMERWVFMEMEVFFQSSTQRSAIRNITWKRQSVIRGKQNQGGIRRENRKQIIAGLRSKNCRNLSIVLTGFIWMKKRVFCMCITGLQTEREVLTRIITVRRKRQRISRFWKEALASAGISRKNFSSYAGS